VIIRGVRNRSDLRHEYQLAAMNEALGITTLLLPAQPELAAMSSTVTRGGPPALALAGPADPERVLPPKLSHPRSAACPWLRFNGKGQSA
jgi:hypothetical protein